MSSTKPLIGGRQRVGRMSGRDPESGMVPRPSPLSVWRIRNGVATFPLSEGVQCWARQSRESGKLYVSNYIKARRGAVLATSVCSRLSSWATAIDLAGTVEDCSTLYNLETIDQ